MAIPELIVTEVIMYAFHMSNISFSFVLCIKGRFSYIIVTSSDMKSEHKNEKSESDFFIGNVEISVFNLFHK